MPIYSFVQAATRWLEEAGADVVDASTAASDEILEADLVVVAQAGQWAPPAPTAVRLPARVVEFAPATLKQTLDQALLLGREADVLPGMMRLIADGERRLAELRTRLGVTRDGLVRGEKGPDVVVLESLEPVVAAGRSVPDLVRAVGARPVLVGPGEPSRRIGVEELGDVGSAVVVILATSAQVPAGVHRFTVTHVMSADLVGEPGPQVFRAAEVLAAAAFGEAAGVTPSPTELRPVGEEVTPHE